MIRLFLIESAVSSRIFRVHIRRTDKIINEQKVPHDIAVYMRHVDDWFSVQEKKLTWVHGEDVKITRRIYLATDDARVTKELREKLATRC